MAFYRSITPKLINWAQNEGRKPLILRGARQTGKTTLIRDFGKKFDSFIELNLEKKADSDLFERDLSVKDLFQAICLEKNVVEGSKVLLFIDEIQNSPKAVAMLRYFYEEMPELYVIGAGSLLEVMIERHKISFPVGRVEYLYLFPMTFEEFLDATGEKVALKMYREQEIPSIAHNKLESLFSLYSFIGGMPEVVSRYAATRDIAQLKPVYESLITSYKDDVPKYAKTLSEANIIRHVIETSPYETGKRIKFEHFGNGNYKSREVGESLRILERAMFLYLRYPVSGHELPLAPNFKLHPRLQFLDTGLLNYALGLTNLYFSGIPLSDAYNGMIAEHIVGQELLASQNDVLQKPILWVREKKQSNAEVDFMIVQNGKIVPVEVKSGSSGTLRSLHSFIEESGIDYALRLYSGSKSVEQSETPKARKPYTLVNLPLYYAGRIAKSFDI
ncbi:MAG: ATP-binding protein [Fibrobacter sp.]|nr:ATP-binding protein [Fibrobacter sp.]